MFYVHKNLNKFISFTIKPKSEEKFHVAFVLLFYILWQYYLRKIIFFQDIL